MRVFREAAAWKDTQASVQAALAGQYGKACYTPEMQASLLAGIKPGPLL